LSVSIKGMKAKESRNSMMTYPKESAALES